MPSLPQIIAAAILLCSVGCGAVRVGVLNEEDSRERARGSRQKLKPPGFRAQLKEPKSKAEPHNKTKRQRQRPAHETQQPVELDQPVAETPAPSGRRSARLLRRERPSPPPEVPAPQYDSYPVETPDAAPTASESTLVLKPSWLPNGSCYHCNGRGERFDGSDFSYCAPCSGKGRRE